MIHTVALLVLLVAAFAFGWSWFGLAMDHGWPLPPAFWPRLVKADGEGWYDASADQLGLIVFLVLAIAYLALVLFLRRRSKRKAIEVISHG
jgi:hypothetical protein